MTEKFKVEFLEEVFKFIDGLDSKTREKILFNIDKATELMKKYFENKNRK